MILMELLASTPIYEVLGLRKIDITGVAVDPNEVREGFLYLYLHDRTDLPYKAAVDKAVAQGAVALCIDKDQPLPEHRITCIKTYHLYRFLSAVAKNFYQNPSQSMNLIGITGSHGKTTVGWMIKCILEAAKTDTIIIGMQLHQIGAAPRVDYNEDFDSLVIHSKLRESFDKGIRNGIIECSYTDIIEEKLRHIHFDSLIYTDLYTYFQNQQADYHYFEIRKNLLDSLKLSNSPIIVNIDDFYARELKRSTTINYGFFSRLGITVDNVLLTRQNAVFTLITPRGNIGIKLKVSGIHNVYNAMAATAWALSEDISLMNIKRGLESFEEITQTYQSEPMKGTIHIVTGNAAFADNLVAAVEKLKSGTKEKLSTIIRTSETQDTAFYQKLEELTTVDGDNLILTTDYNDQSNNLDAVFAIVDNLTNKRVCYEADNFKALQKAVSASEDGGTILLWLDPVSI